MRPAAAAAELLGTGVVAFTVGCNVSAPNAPIEWQIASIACSLLAMMSAFGSISGGHLNPAVSLSMLCLGKIQLADAAAYLILQVAGAILGMLFASSIFQVSPPPVSSASLHGADLVVEGIFVLMLNFVILCVTGRRNHPESEPNQFYSVAASAALAAGLGSTQLKGGVLNPALTIALRLAGFGGFEAGVVGLVIAQLVAALLAAGLVQLLRPEEQLSTESFQNYIPKFGTRLGSELIGTTFLILTIGLSLQDQRRWWAPACALVGLVYALGDLSGGHFNPAVTTAVVLSRTRMLTTSDLLGFWASQVLGSVLATLALMALVPHFQWDLSPQAPFQAGAAYIMEFTFCIVLCLAVLSASCIKGIASDFSRNFYFGLAVGVALLAGSLSCGRISGACLNPAVALIVVVSSVLHSDTSAAFYASNYCLAQLFTGVTSAVLFRSTHAKEYASKSRTARLPFQMA